MTPTSQFTPFESNGLVYKLHPRFFTQNFGKKVRLIHEFLRYSLFDGTVVTKENFHLKKNSKLTTLSVSNDNENLSLMNLLNAMVYM